MKPNEIILVDAESSDNTVTVARQYPVKVISVPFHDIYRSKRVGILEAENDIVLCIDGDSYVNEHFVEEGLKLLQEYDLATGHVYPSNSNPLSELFGVLSRRLPPYLSGPAYLVKKNVYFETCNIECNLDQCSIGEDVCATAKEVPLKTFENRVKSSNMIIYTELPSSLQMQFIVLGLVGGGFLWYMTKS